MSSLLYGALSQRRVATAEDRPLQLSAPEGAEGGLEAGVAGAPEEPAPGSPAAGTQLVSHLTDVLVALVPAEVLALHAVAMNFGTTTTGTGDGATTVISHPGQMQAVFILLAVLAAGLYFAGAKKFSRAHVVRALTASAAFVFWTMLQPGTAFDAFPFGLSPLLRIIIPLVGAIALGIVINGMATMADKKDA